MVGHKGLNEHDLPEAGRYMGSNTSPTSIYDPFRYHHRSFMALRTRQYFGTRDNLLSLGAGKGGIVDAEVGWP